MKNRLKYRNHINTPKPYLLLVKKQILNRYEVATLQKAKTNE